MWVAAVRMPHLSSCEEATERVSNTESAMEDEANKKTSVKSEFETQRW